MGGGPWPGKLEFVLSRRNLLLQSISSAALLTASSGPGSADEAHSPPHGYSFSIESSYINGTLQGIDKIGDYTGINYLGPFRGYNVALTLNKKINENWDIQGNAAYVGFLDGTYSETTTGSSGGTTYSTASDYRGAHAFQVVDFEIGYRPPEFSAEKIRLFGGLRVLQSNKSSDLTAITTSPSDPTTTGYFNYNTKFKGIGIRAGTSASTRFPYSDFGASAMVAGSAMYGREELSYALDIDGTVTSTSDTKSKIAYNLDAALGLDWFVNSTSSVGAGYKIQEYWNIGENLSGVSGTTQDLIHGPFIKYISTF